MNDSMFDRSLEDIESKVKFIENIFDYLDSIEEEFDSFVSLNEKITELVRSDYYFLYFSNKLAVS